MQTVAKLFGNFSLQYGTYTCFHLQATIVQDNDMNYNYCVYDSDISTGYGVGAFLFLMASQVLIMVASQCFCCGKALKPVGSRTWAILLFVICWYVTILKNFMLWSLNRIYQVSYHFKKQYNPLKFLLTKVCRMLCLQHFVHLGLGLWATLGKGWHHARTPEGARTPAQV